MVRFIIGISNTTMFVVIPDMCFCCAFRERVILLDHDVLGLLGDAQAFDEPRPGLVQLAVPISSRQT